MSLKTEIGRVAEERNAMQRRAEAAEADWQAVTRQRDELLEALKAVSNRLAAELDTPDDIWADHIREAMRFADEAIATAEATSHV